MRLFFCVELEEGVKAALTGLTAGLRPKLGPGVKWVAEDALHITVRFLGEVPEGEASGILRVGHEVAEVIPPFCLVLERLGAFPSPRRARVIWAGSEGDGPQFAGLTRLTENALGTLGFPPEPKEAKPHVTLARLRTPRDVADALAVIPVSPMTVEVRALTLMQSELQPKGARYTPLERWPLGG